MALVTKTSSRVQGHEQLRQLAPHSPPCHPLNMAGTGCEACWHVRVWRALGVLDPGGALLSHFAALLPVDVNGVVGAVRQHLGYAWETDGPDPRSSAEGHRPLMTYARWFRQI